AHDELRVVGETPGGVAVRPAARVLERLRQVPVVERREGADAGLEQGVGEPAVVVEPLRIRGAAPGRLDARPGDREAVAGESHLLLERDVLGPAVIGVAGAIAGVAVLDPAGRVREAVPDRLALAVGLPRALDLVGRGRGAPAEAVREDELRHHASPLIAASTCSGWASAFATRFQCFFTLPSGPIHTVERITPTVFFPYIVFSPQAP